MAQIWNNHSQAEYNRMAGAPAYLPPAFQCHWERIRQARLLRSGQHRQYFLAEQRSQFDFPPLEANGRRITPFIHYGLLGLIANKSGDLLFGQEPLLAAEDNARQQEALDALADRCNLQTVLHAAATTASSEAGAFLEAVEWDGEVYIQEVDGQEIFPVGRLMPDNQHRSYQRYQVSDDQKMLLISTYAPGSIQRELWSLSEVGAEAGNEGSRHTAKGQRLDINLWPDKPAIWGEDVRTGMSVNLITWIPNILYQRRAYSDFDGCIDHQDKINAANTQIARILAQHADPFMAFPRSSFDDLGNVRAREKAIPKGDDPNDKPEYIAIPGQQLEEAMKDRSNAVNALLITSETSPSLLGIEEKAAPEAYKTLRLRAFNSLSKAQRRSLYFTIGLKWALVAAQELENTTAGKAGYAIGPVSVTLRDGIPVDEREQAETIATLRAAGMSREWMVGQLINDSAQAEAELQRQLEEEKAKMPTIFGEPGEGYADEHGSGMHEEAGKPAAAQPAPQPTAQPVPQGEEQSDAVAGTDLRSTVDALNAIRELQGDFYGGKLPREAAIANAKLMLGFTEEEAEGLFPDVEPDAPGTGDDSGQQITGKLPVPRAAGQAGRGTTEAASNAA